MTRQTRGRRVWPWVRWLLAFAAFYCVALVIVTIMAPPGPPLMPLGLAFPLGGALTFLLVPTPNEEKAPPSGEANDRD